MKATILTLMLFFSCLTTYSQMNGGFGMQRQRMRQMNQTQRPAPKINYEVEKYLGIVIYDDIEKAAKKTGIKLNSDEGKAFKTAIGKYNRKISDLRRINSFTIKSTKEMVENFQRNARKTGDLSDRQRVQKKMQEDLKPIADALRAEDIIFDTKMREILNKKQYKKWVKYNRKLYKKFPDPEATEE